MEESPFQPHQPEAKPESPAPEQIGDLLLRYELPASEPNPKLLDARKSLRDKINGYRELTAMRPKAPSSEANPTIEIPEAHFESRHEAIDKATQSAVIAPEPTVPSTVPSVSPNTFQRSPNPLVVAPPVDSAAQLSEEPAESTAAVYFKKPLLVGLAAGACTAILLILIYFRN